MSEERWLKESRHPQGLVRQLQGTSITRTKVGRRKLRLFACGCCRAMWPHLTDARMTQAIEVSELFADGKSAPRELVAVRELLGPLVSGGYGRDEPGVQSRTAASLAQAAAAEKPFEAAISMTVYQLPLAGYCGDDLNANQLICDLLRDIFGNPFRPVTFAPEWRTDTAVAIAQGMYESRDFGAMPILADALQDAGCDSDDVLNHCRDAKAPHVRGCWVVDLLLGKA